MPDQPKILTATEAVAAAVQSPAIPTPITDPLTIESVQRDLRDKGYVELNEIDGKLEGLTKDAILSFRGRNNLPLVPVIDDQFLAALEAAPKKEQPLRVQVATVEDLKPRVEAVKVAAEAESKAWWQKIGSAIVGTPSVLLGILIAAIDHIDEAVTAIQPIKSLFYDLPIGIGWWLLGFGLIAGLFGYQAYRIEKLSKLAKDSMVEGYREGTVKNDAKPNGVMP